MKNSLQTENILKVSSTEREGRVPRAGWRAESSKGKLILPSELSAEAKVQ
jgi:hypothetical protein